MTMKASTNLLFIFATILQISRHNAQNQPNYRSSSVNPGFSSNNINSGSSFSSSDFSSSSFSSERSSSSPACVSLLSMIILFNLMNHHLILNIFQSQAADLTGEQGLEMIRLVMEEARSRSIPITICIRDRHDNMVAQVSNNTTCVNMIFFMILYDTCHNTS